MTTKHRNQHEWVYMGHSKDWTIEYGFCELCNRWKKSDEPKKLFKMKPGVYKEMRRTGEIVGV